MEPVMMTLPGDGVDIQLARWAGEGEPILAVHGLTANCRSYDVVAAGLGGAHGFTAMDLRGRGLSGKPDSGYSIDHHCRDIEAVLDGLDLETVTLMGHSLGAYICLAMAAFRPERIKRLILVDGGADLPPEQWGKIAVAIKPSLDRLGVIFPSFEAYLDNVKAAPYLKPWSEAIENYFRYESHPVQGGLASRINPAHIDEERANLARFRPPEHYPRVKCPVLVLRATEGMLGDDDLVLPDGATADLKAALRQARVVDLSGVNHFSMIFQPHPDRDRAILEFMRD